jgi:hypothetical protein
MMVPSGSAGAGGGSIVMNGASPCLVCGTVVSIKSLKDVEE